MHFLLVYTSPGILGGIETLIARMSQWLVANGHKVTLLIESPGSWTSLLPKEAQCIALEDRFGELYYYYHTRRLWKTLNISKPDVIKSFDMGSSWIACQLAALMGDNCKVVAGIYNPLLFKWYYSSKTLPWWDANRLYLRNYLNHIPVSARLFCGFDQVEELEETHREKGILWPIPIDTTQFVPASRRPQWGKIVSIGRLAPMKEYNLYMIDVVKLLRDKGYDVTWSVYGVGDYEAVMRDKIRGGGLEQCIFMRGVVPYAQFRKVLEDGYIFVGMGTSILEAALFRVPNVNAIAYDREGLTDGPVYNFPPGSIGPGNAPPQLKVSDEIERILNLSPEGYRAEEERVGESVKVHEMDDSMKYFLGLVREAKPVKSHKLFYLINYPLWAVRRLLKKLLGARDIGHPPALFAGPVKAQIS
ncbi:MAG TPA: glycosyltransferase family 4 protein [Verrucomicrobiae bacterium]|nr:glycosyltransferase family 4 protein [Verrucomicrobiae bacterium]